MSAMPFQAKFTAFIQAAGRSSRMGANKAVLQVGGLSVICRALRAARTLTQRVLIVTNEPEVYVSLGAQTIPDKKAGLGPLAGIQLGIESSDTPWMLNLACDLPFVSGEFLQFLSSYTTCWQAVVPTDQQGRAQSMCAFFHRSVAQDVRALLNEGERRPRELFSRVRTRYLEFSRFSHLPMADLFFFDMNSPSDYEEAVRISKLRGC